MMTAADAADDDGDDYRRHCRIVVTKTVTNCSNKDSDDTSLDMRDGEHATDVE